MKIMIMLAFLISLTIGVITLQVFLSKSKNKWIGLMCPLITFFYSLLMVFGLSSYAGISKVDIFISVASTFLIANIPTFVLLAIYFLCREKAKIHSQLDKMNIQDLD